MFGNRNYSGYSLSTPSRLGDINLHDAVKVSKLKNSQLSVYFNALKTSSSTRKEFFKRSQHFEEFKKTINDRRAGNLRSQNVATKGVFDSSFKEFMKKYELGSNNGKDEVGLKPVIRRAPLKNIKTIGIEVPSIYKEEAIYTLPKKRSVDAYVQIAKPIRSTRKPVVKIQLPGEEEPVVPNQTPKSVIEEQLQQTKDEIDAANIQLEQIKSLLNNRKASLSPVEEGIEDVEEKANMVRELVDKKCSPIQPRTQWTVKSSDAGRSTQVKKNKLMSTLNNLNKRLQHIQEKYFNEPKIKYKAISDFIPPRSKETLQTLYRNADYGKDSRYEANVLTVEDQSAYSGDDDYINGLITRTEKLTKVNKKKKVRTDELKSNDSVLVLMPPNTNAYKESEADTTPKELGERTRSGRSILKRNRSSADSFNTVLEAPLLQDSIYKSNYLMKEFNLNVNDKNFDLAMIKTKRNDHSTSTESLKKNVRFSYNVNKTDSKKDTCLTSNIDMALKNSIFYQDIEDEYA